MTDSQIRTIATLRSQMYGAIREFFAQKNYVEVEVPLLTTTLIPESYLEIFETQIVGNNKKSTRAFLTPSPEIYLKKLLVSGIGSCFTITKSFRNSDTSNLHSPEFSLLEWYQAGADYMKLMDEVEKMVWFVLEKIQAVILAQAGIHQPESKARIIDSRWNLPRTMIRGGNDKNRKLIYNNQTIDLTPPWERLSMIEAFEIYANVDLLAILDNKAMKQFAGSKGYKVEPDSTWEQLFNQIYLNEIEPHLGKGRPTVIYDFPAPLAALARKKSFDTRFAERFEVYIGGLELADAYSELTDWKEQEERFKAEAKERKRLGKIDHPVDWEFIEALKAGLPECSGCALGLDRLLMLFADEKKIDDAMLFKIK